jgi:hypothetical protein
VSYRDEVIAIFGNGLDDLLRQPGGVEEESDDGLVTAKETFWIRTDLFIAKRPAPGNTPHPDHRNIVCDSIRRCYHPKTNKVSIIEAVYKGVYDPPPPPKWELDGSVDEEPIETHKNGGGLIGTPKEPKNKAIFDEDGQFLGFPADAPHDLGGVRGYLSPGATVTASDWIDTIPSGFLANLGTIDALPSWIGVTTGGIGRDWLLIAASWKQYNTVFQLRRTWKLSGRKGWNRRIYTY